MNTKTINFSMISLFQFVFSILVIALHCTRLFNNDVAHFIQKSFFSRMAVPYFMICSSFFLTLKKESKTGYLQKHVTKIIKTYFLWSLFYLPYAVIYFKSLNLSNAWLPIAFLVGLFYSGICYHLWYIPAFFFGFLLVNLMIRKLGYRITFSCCCLLYLIGATETYSVFLQESMIGDIYDSYQSVFYTTRNGLFYAPIFIFLGIILSQNRDNSFFKKNSFRKLIIAIVLFAMEACLIFFNQGDDKNFFIMLVPFSLFLFNWTIQTNQLKSKNFYRLKHKSILFYFLHPVFIELFPLAFYFVDPKANYYGWLKFVVTLSFCQLAYVLVVNLRNKEMFQLIHRKILGSQ